MTILRRKLSRIRLGDNLTMRSGLVKCFQKLLNQIFILRNRILSHKNHDLCLRIPCRQISRSAVIELRLRHMMDFQTTNSLVSFLIPVGFLCVHYNDPAWLHCLLGKHLQKSRKTPVRPIRRNQHIYRHSSSSSCAMRFPQRSPYQAHTANPHAIITIKIR